MQSKISGCPSHDAPGKAEARQCSDRQLGSKRMFQTHPQMHAITGNSYPAGMLSDTARYQMFS
jgi:hypothetical protein